MKQVHLPLCFTGFLRVKTFLKFGYIIQCIIVGVTNVNIRKRLGIEPVLMKDDIKNTLQQHGLTINDTRRARARILKTPRHQKNEEQQPLPSLVTE
jgi:hypothetical protein